MLLQLNVIAAAMNMILYIWSSARVLVCYIEVDIALKPCLFVGQDCFCV